MPFLLRVELPDVPGSLGRLATAIGEAGGDIDAIEIVEHAVDGFAVDDVLLDVAPGTLPDSIVTACNSLDGVRVLWISRYAAGGNLFMDLEAVEAMTAVPETAIDRLIELLPVTFRADWAARLDKSGVLTASGAAPDGLMWSRVTQAMRINHPEDPDTLVCAAPLVGDDVVLIGRRGGPDFLDSELARLGHLVALAVSIAK